VRREIFKQVKYKWAFVSEPVPLLAVAPRVLDITKSLAFAAFRDFFGLIRAVLAGPFWWAVQSMSHLALDAGT
jgi:hypothetical protein